MLSHLYCGPDGSYKITRNLEISFLYLMKNNIDFNFIFHPEATSQKTKTNKLITTNLITFSRLKQRYEYYIN